MLALSKDFVICKCFIGKSSMHELKSPSKIALSHLDDSESNLCSWKESPDVILYCYI